MTAKEKVKYLEAKIQQEIWKLQMLDYEPLNATDNLYKMQKELQEVKQEIKIGKQLMTQRFNEWMAKIGNIYYADDNRMAKAFKIIAEYEEL